ncbi:MAG: hypothetical protein AB1757_16940 [Acidobacteriota bacterium]
MMNNRRPLLALTTISLCLLLVFPVLAAPKFQGKWRLTVNLPEAPGSNVTRTMVFMVDASPRIESLHGRMTLTDEASRTVGGVWRQVAKRVSITTELPCSPDVPCASLVMIGKIKGEVIKKGDVIVMWDTLNPNNHAQYDTSNGTFSAVRLP